MERRKERLLLSKAAASGFAVMITMDNGVAYQQNISTLPVTVVILSAHSNDIDDLRPLIPQLLQALNAPIPSTIVRIG